MNRTLNLKCKYCGSTNLFFDEIAFIFAPIKYITHPNKSMFKDKETYIGPFKYKEARFYCGNCKRWEVLDEKDKAKI